MKTRLLLTLVAVVFLLSLALAGCQESGISQELYDKVVAQFNEAQQKIQEARDNIANMETERDSVMAELGEAKSKVGELEGMINALRTQYELTGATPAETAEKIVKYYHETHVYSTYDLFICSDMAAEVWNMLKAQEIDAVIAVGDVHNTIADIVKCNHAWVLAEVAPGEDLALETTGGFTVTKSENPLYYSGWTFDSPAELKRYNQLVSEYNILVGVRNDINDEANEVAEEHNQSTNPATADKLKAVYDKLVELRDAQEAELVKIRREISGLATRCGT